MSWRCFFCDELFTTAEAAAEHFGSQEYEALDPPACVDPLRTDEKERIKEVREAREYALACQRETDEVIDRADMLEVELIDFKELTHCQSVHELRMWLDFREGELVTARELSRLIQERAPELYEELIYGRTTTTKAS